MDMISLPKKPKTILRKGNMGVFEIDELYPGYGITLGNALRRVLLSSLPGSAITSVKIKGVSHEFSSLPGVREDVVDIILNLKQLRLKLHGDEPQRVTLNVKGEREVTAKEIKAPSQVEVVNKDLHIATLTDKKAELDMEIDVERGLGYVPVDARKKEKLEVGMIAIDSIFTPIRKVNYDVEKMRVGERTDYNKLRFHIETDGTINPEEAIEKSIQILLDQFGAIKGGSSKKKEKESKTSKAETKSLPKPGTVRYPAKKGLESIRKTKIEELALSRRTVNALVEAGVKTAGGLTQKNVEDLGELGGLGGKGIKEIEKALKKLGLSLK